jgi:hypothetical protein
MAISKGSKGQHQQRRREAKEAQEAARLTQKPLKTKQRKNSMKLFGNAALLTQYGNTFAEWIDRFQLINKVTTVLNHKYS